MPCLRTNRGLNPTSRIVRDCERVMRIFSACETDLSEPQVTDAKLTTAP